MINNTVLTAWSLALENNLDYNYTMYSLQCFDIATGAKWIVKMTNNTDWKVYNFFWFESNKWIITKSYTLENTNTWTITCNIELWYWKVFENWLDIFILLTIFFIIFLPAILAILMFKNLKWKN